MNEKEFATRMTELLPYVDSVTMQNFQNYAAELEIEEIGASGEYFADIFVQFGLIKQHYSEDIIRDLLDMAKDNILLNYFELRPAAHYLSQGISFSSIRELANAGQCQQTDREWDEFKEARKAFDAEKFQREDTPNFTLSARLFNKRIMFEERHSALAEITFPAAKEAVALAFEKLKITDCSECGVMEVQSSLPKLAKRLEKDNHIGIDELNYLVAKISGLGVPFEFDYFDTFAAVVEMDKHCRSVKDYINLTESLDNFYIQPAFNAEQYGEFCIDNNIFFEELLDSTKEADIGLREFIAGLIVCVDRTNYGEYLADLEQGKFTEFGYITVQKFDTIKEVYHGSQDIPAEFLVTGFNVSTAIAKAEDTIAFCKIDTDLAQLATARAAVDVFRLSDRGTERLASTIAAIDTRLWQSGKYEFVVKQEDLPKLEPLKLELDSAKKRTLEHSAKRDAQEI
jgi:hypothetical protein